MRGMERGAQRLRQGSCLAFAAVLAAAMGYAYIAFAQSSATLACAPLGALFCAAFVFGAGALRRLPAQTARRWFAPATAGMVAVYVLVSLWFMRAYRYTPVWDLDAVFTGAQSWLEGSLTARGSATYDASTYFYYFPNNLGATLVLRTWLALTRGMDAYLSACTLNMLLSAGMIVCTALAGQEMGGERMGLMALGLLGCTLPIWFSCAAFYTDFLSIAFPVAALWLALLAQRQQTRGRRALCWALYGLAVGVGALIKITVLILPIGATLWQALRGKWKDALCLGLAAALFFGAGQAILHGSVYPDQLDPQLARQMNTPVAHWIMMGLRGDGHYNSADYEFTRSFSDPDEARSAIYAEIACRIGEYGPGGLINHLLRKMGVCISDGTLMLSDYYDDSPQAPGWLTALLLPGGRAYGLWQALCGGIHMAQLVFAVRGALLQARRGAKGVSGALSVCLFGLLVFLSFWETSRRYWINFLPLFVLCAAQGALGGEKARGGTGAEGAGMLY